MQIRNTTLTRDEFSEGERATVGIPLEITRVLPRQRAATIPDWWRPLAYDCVTTNDGIHTFVVDFHLML